MRHLSITLLTLLTLTVSSARAQKLFPDKNLEDAVRKQVFAKRNNDQPLVAKDVENISTVKGRGMGIKNLKGLEACRALASLDLAENEVTDLTPIKDLTHLQQLTLNKNKISDLKPLAGLKHLQYLQLEDNQVKDISPLAELKSLNSLYLSRNQIADISAVKGLDKLWSLYLGENPIKSIEPLKEVKGLSTLDLRSTGTADLSPIKHMSELTFLFLQHNKLADLSTLVEMAKADEKGEFAPFWKVYLDGNPLNDAGKKQLEELKKLGVRVHVGEK